MSQESKVKITTGASSISRFNASKEKRPVKAKLKRPAIRVKTINRKTVEKGTRSDGSKAKNANAEDAPSTSSDSTPASSASSAVKCQEFADATSYVWSDFTDYKCALWLAQPHLNDAKAIRMFHVGDVKKDFGPRPVFAGIVPKKEDLIELLQKSERVKIIDHHKNVAEQLDELSRSHPEEFKKIDFVYKEGSCVSEIVWKLFNSQPLPRWLQLVKDRHLWTFSLPGTREFHAWMEAENDYDKAGLDKVHSFSEEQLEAAIVKGAIHLQEFNDEVKRIAAAAKKMTFLANGKRYKVLYAMCDAKYRSDAANEMAKRDGCDFAVVAREIPGNALAISMRAVKDVGLCNIVQELCETYDQPKDAKIVYGGGGGSGFGTGLRIDGLENFGKFFVDDWSEPVVQIELPQETLVEARSSEEAH